MAQARFATSMRARFLVGEQEASGNVSNVSDGGLFIETPSLPELGDTVTVTLTRVDGAALELSGMVWWTTGDPPGRRHARTGFGLRLLEECDDWAGWIDQLAS